MVVVIFKLKCLYVSGVFIMELVWLVIGVIWISHNYASCPASSPKKAVLGKNASHVNH